jgi:hypothetical protein
MSTRASREFSKHLMQEVRDGYGERVLAPMPERNRERGQRVRDAASGRRPTHWEEVDDPMPEAHAQMNAFLRSAFPPDEEE